MSFQNLNDIELFFCCFVSMISPTSFSESSDFIEPDQFMFVREVNSGANFRTFIVRLKVNKQMLFVKEIKGSKYGIRTQYNAIKFLKSPILSPPVAISKDNNYIFYLFAENGSVSDNLSNINATQQQIILYGVICGLSTLHENGIVHNNIKLL